MKTLITNFTHFSIPNIKKTFPVLTAMELVAVQPMMMPRQRKFGLFFIGDVRRFLFIPGTWKWNSFIRTITASLEDTWLFRSDWISKRRYFKYRKDCLLKTTPHTELVYTRTYTDRVDPQYRPRVKKI